MDTIDLTTTVYQQQVEYDQLNCATERGYNPMIVCLGGQDQATTTLQDCYSYTPAEEAARWFATTTVPLTSPHIIYLMPLVYALVLVVGKWHMRRSQPKGYDIQHVLIVHNWCMSIGSLALLLGFAQHIIMDIMWSQSATLTWQSLFFDPSGIWTSNKMYVLIYINYLFKYVELLDTVFLVLRQKPTPLLHVYHHSATLILCLTQLVGRTSLQWLVITLNLFVHVWMYAYYALQANEHKTIYKWKQTITVLQIVQFVIGLVVGNFGLALHYFGWFPLECLNWTFYFGHAIISSYLILFIRFYAQTYSLNKKH